MSRFVNKQVIDVSVTCAAKDAEGLLNAIITRELTSHLLPATLDGARTEARSDDAPPRSAIAQIYVHLITGVNLMIPFVIAGGILIALSFSFGITAATPSDAHFSPIAKMLSDIGGGSAFALMLPILSLGISQSISGKMGMVAIHTGSGFLGALIAGFLAGYITKLIVDYVTLPKAVADLKPILIVPLLSV
nr:hypothetical protein [Sodalis glossinidius]